MDPSARSAHLQRNKSERWRLQGLQKVQSTDAPSAQLPKSFGQKLNVWMINEGHRSLFFAVFLGLHLLAGVLAWLHYSLKDNLTGARATFGITFGALFWTRKLYF
jgi:NADPH oxidase